MKRCSCGGCNLAKDYIYKRVQSLSRKYGSCDPFSLLDCLNVVVRESDHFSQLKGFCFFANRTYYVVLNPFLGEEEKRIAAAHELAHIVLHSQELRVAPMKDSQLYDMTSRAEYEANLFAADLLIADQDVDTLSKDEDMNYFKMCRALNVTPDLMSFKLFSLVHRGFAYNMPMGIDSRFLAKPLPTL